MSRKRGESFYFEEDQAPSSEISKLSELIDTKREKVVPNIVPEVNSDSENEKLLEEYLENNPDFRKVFDKEDVSAKEFLKEVLSQEKTEEILKSKIESQEKEDLKTESPSSSMQLDIKSPKPIRKVSKSLLENLSNENIR